MKKKLPNFLIVGAAKSGTSSLHNYLSQHDEVFMPDYKEGGMKVKEPRFLIKDLVQHRLHNGIWEWEDYQSLFTDVRQEKAIGEATVLYLYYFEHAIQNIKKYLGEDIRIVIILRNPVDRAYSAFQHVSRGFQEENSFEEALRIESERLDNDNSLTPMVMYKSMGLYYKMVKAYLDAFKHVHIILHEEFKDNTRLEMEKLFRFLEIKNNDTLDIFTKYNVGGKKWKSHSLKRMFLHDNIIKKIFSQILPKNIRLKIRKKLVDLSMEKYTPMNESTREMLNEFFREDVKRLSELLNKDLTYWIKS